MEPKNTKNAVDFEYDGFRCSCIPLFDRGKNIKFIYHPSIGKSRIEFEQTGIMKKIKEENGEIITA